MVSVDGFSYGVNERRPGMMGLGSATPGVWHRSAEDLGHEAGFRPGGA